MEERILTLHPEGKQGSNISKQKYETIKNTLVEILAERGEMTFQNLTKETHKRLAGKFDGKITWYVITVKLDLEARGIIKRVAKTSPQRVKLHE